MSYDNRLAQSLRKSERRKIPHVVAAVMTFVVPCFGQPSATLHQEPFVVEGTSLHMSIQAFQMKMPGAQSMSYHAAPKSKTCTLHKTIRFGGLTSSKANFNFDAGLLTNISLWFYPAPSNREIQQMMDSLKKNYGTPTEEKGASGETLWRWSRKGSQMILEMPYPS